MNFKFMKQKSEKKRYCIVGKYSYTLKLIANSKNSFKIFMFAINRTNYQIMLLI